MRIVGGTSRPSKTNASRPSGPRTAVKVIAANPSRDRTTGGSGSNTRRLPHAMHASAAVNTIHRLIAFLRESMFTVGQTRYHGTTHKKAVGRLDQHRAA